MATTSIKKNFVISSKKSAVELATQLLDVEKTVTPTLTRPRISKAIMSTQILSYLSKSDSLPSGGKFGI